MVDRQPPGPSREQLQMNVEVERWPDGCVWATIVVTGVFAESAVFAVKYATNISSPHIVALAGEGLAAMARGFGSDVVWGVLEDLDDYPTSGER